MKKNSVEVAFINAYEFVESGDQWSKDYQLNGYLVTRGFTYSVQVGEYLIVSTEELPISLVNNLLEDNQGDYEQILLIEGYKVRDLESVIEGIMSGSDIYI